MKLKFKDQELTLYDSIYHCRSDSNKKGYGCIQKGSGWDSRTYYFDLVPITDPFATKLRYKKKSNGITYAIADSKPLVDLHDWAHKTYPKTYSTMTELDQDGIDYLNSVRGTGMGNMFYNCSSLTTLDVSNWDTSQVTSMTYMFDGCRSLTSLDVSNWDTTYVLDMNCLFEGCSSLITLDLSNWDTSNVMYMSYMFYTCSSLTTLDVSNWDTSYLETTYNMFNGCNLLEYLIIGSPIFKFKNIGSSCGLNTTCKILVPSALLNTFKTSTKWSSRASQFDAIENYNITRSNGKVTVTPK